MIIKSCFPANKEGDTPPPYTATEKPFRVILVKRLIRSYRCSFVLKLSHSVTHNVLELRPLELDSVQGQAYLLYLHWRNVQ